MGVRHAVIFSAGLQHDGILHRDDAANRRGEANAGEAFDHALGHFVARQVTATVDDIADAAVALNDESHRHPALELWIDPEPAFVAPAEHAIRGAYDLPDHE